MPLTKGDEGKQIVKMDSIWVLAIQAGLKALEWNLMFMFVTTRQNKNLMNIEKRLVAAWGRGRRVGKMGEGGQKVQMSN